MSVAPARSSVLAVRRDYAPTDQWGTRTSFWMGTS